MPSWGCEIDASRFYANLKRLRPRIMADAKAVAQKTNTKFAQHLRRNTPKDEGKLASTIREHDKSAGDKIEHSTTIGNDAEEIYAAPLEFGHVLNGTHIQGKHYIFPLASIYNKRFKAALRRDLKKIYKDFS